MRERICSECNTKYNRDLNASINILNQELKDLILVS
ncbi:zinc ribbon domain-containing protein [Anaerosalibacter massiliensis]